MTTDTPAVDLTDADFEALVSTTLDDIEDLPEYADYMPTGAYVLNIVESGFEKVEMAVDKKDDSKGKKTVNVAKVVFEVEEAKELKTPDEAILLKPKMRFSQSYFFNKDPKKTTEVMKLIYKEVAKKLPSTTSFLELVKALAGFKVVAVVSSTPRQGKPDEYFINIKNLQVL